MNQENLAKLRVELTRDEGERLRAYKDSRGFWTIGVGHLVGEDPDHLGDPRMWIVTREESQALLDLDIRVAYECAKRCVPAFTYWAGGRPGGFRAYNQSRARALVNMAFNRGERHMRMSTSIVPAIVAASEGRGTWSAVADAIRVSPWAKQVGARAARLAKMFLTDD